MTKPPHPRPDRPTCQRGADQAEHNRQRSDITDGVREQPLGDHEHDEPKQLDAPAEQGPQQADHEILEIAPALCAPPRACVNVDHAHH